MNKEAVQSVTIQALQVPQERSPRNKRFYVNFGESAMFNISARRNNRRGYDLSYITRDLEHGDLFFNEQTINGVTFPIDASAEAPDAFVMFPVTERPVDAKYNEELFFEFLHEWLINTSDAYRSQNIEFIVRMNTPGAFDAPDEDEREVRWQRVEQLAEELVDNIRFEYRYSKADLPRYGSLSEEDK